VTFKEAAPETASLSYLRKTWPQFRPELCDPTYGSMRFGWNAIDDQFNSTWKQAPVNCAKTTDRALEFTFVKLSDEYPAEEMGTDPRHTRDFHPLPQLGDSPDIYDGTYRRTLGIRIDGVEPASVAGIEVFTKAEVVSSEIRVTLDARKRTPGNSIALSAYNASIDEVTPESGVQVHGLNLDLTEHGARSFRIRLTHLKPEGYFSYDEGLVTFALDHDAFTISLDSLAKQGPIWYAEEGVFITLAGDTTTFADYEKRNEGKKTTAELVVERTEQSLGNSLNGQPRPHQCAGGLGCKHCRQRFWIEPNCDIVFHRYNIDPIKGRDTQRFKNAGRNGRLFFGLERWSATGRSLEPGPTMILNSSYKRDSLVLKTQAFAVPLDRPIFDDLEGDDTIICLMKFKLHNKGSEPTSVEIPISYSSDSTRSGNLISRMPDDQRLTDRRVPRSQRENLTLKELGTDANGTPLQGVIGEYEGQQVLRCAFAGDLRAESTGDAVSIRVDVAPGEKREIVLKIPYIDLDQREEIKALAALDFEKCREDVRKFWREECRTGAQLRSPEPQLDEFHRGHLAFVEITDSKMPGTTDQINTSVGTSTYGNYVNESAMIIEELEQRGLHEQTRQRLNVWLKHQGTAGLKGKFTDHDGVFYGAGGYESGSSYCQHHGWAMWSLARHYFLTGDAVWLNSIADQLLKGVDWVARQRNETMGDLPHSRGWERGWLAPGGLEDVDDYFYWLSTNTMTYRGVEWVARALEAIKHPEAARVRREADDYRKALIRGFETARQHSPIVRLMDGRWIPHYPSRLYRRGRDLGWIREILEGAVYLLIGELFAPNSKQAQWILDDFNDNRYMDPQFGYPVYQLDRNWFDWGGFSQQPDLLAGLMPHLDRDEPEIYIWMFFNSFAACYREEIGGMIEHPHPILGFSNHVAYKTSDEANSVMWLRYMYVYHYGKILHLGRAIPREWLSDGNDIWVADVATPFGPVSVRYKSSAASGTITAEIDFKQRTQPGEFLVRFRHPGKLKIKSVKVNGCEHAAFDPDKDNVNVTGMTGKVEVVATYEPWAAEGPVHRLAHFWQE